jgi:hypothetical protein
VQLTARHAKGRALPDFGWLQCPDCGSTRSGFAISRLHRHLWRGVLLLELCLPRARAARPLGHPLQVRSPVLITGVKGGDHGNPQS